MLPAAKPRGHFASLSFSVWMSYCHFLPNQAKNSYTGVIEVAELEFEGDGHVQRFPELKLEHCGRLTTFDLAKNQCNGAVKVADLK